MQPHTQSNSFLLLPCPSVKVQKDWSFAGQDCPELLLGVDSLAPVRILAKEVLKKGQVHWGSA
jgi:hypothetical protein